MAYENINVTSAKNAINNCLSQLNYSTSKELLSTLPGSTNWVADSKDTFVAAINKLVNTRYKELEDYLKQCLTALDNIEKIQELQDQNKSYDSQINSKQRDLNDYNSRYSRMDDKTTDEAKNLKKKIDNLKNEIDGLKKNKSSNSDEISRINSNIKI